MSLLNLSLEFRYPRRMQIGSFNKTAIDVGIEQAYKDKINKLYWKHIKEINESGSWIDLVVSQDGKSIIDHQLIGTTEILDKFSDPANF